MQNYTYVATLGEGAYGAVWRCRDKRTGLVVAVKAFKQAHEDKDVMRLATRELKVLESVRHPNLVQLLEAFKSPNSGRVYMVFENVASCVQKELTRFPGGLPPRLTKVVVWQLLHALTYLHSNKILHRDVKPANVLLGDGAVVKLCDFGFSRGTSCEPTQLMDATSYVVTRWYRAPEILLSDCYGPSADIWSVGCTVAEIATGRPLFPGSSTANQLWHIIRSLGPMPTHLTAPEGSHYGSLAPPPFACKTLRARLPELDARLFQLVEACLQLDPRLRPTAADLLQMPYFWDVQDLIAGTPVANLAHRAPPRSGPAKGTVGAPCESGVDLAGSGAPPASRPHTATATTLPQLNLALPSAEAQPNQPHRRPLQLQPVTAAAAATALVADAGALGRGSVAVLAGKDGGSAAMAAVPVAAAAACSGSSVSAGPRGAPILVQAMALHLGGGGATRAMPVRLPHSPEEQPQAPQGAAGGCPSAGPHEAAPGRAAELHGRPHAPAAGAGHKGVACASGSDSGAEFATAATSCSHNAQAPAAAADHGCQQSSGASLPLYHKRVVPVRVSSVSAVADLLSSPLCGVASSDTWTALRTAGSLSPINPQQHSAVPLRQNVLMRNSSVTCWEEAGTPDGAPRARAPSGFVPPHIHVRAAPHAPASGPNSNVVGAAMFRRCQTELPHDASCQPHGGLHGVPGGEAVSARPSSGGADHACARGGGMLSAVTPARLGGRPCSGSNLSAVSGPQLPIVSGLGSGGGGTRLGRALRNTAHRLVAMLGGGSGGSGAALAQQPGFGASQPSKRLGNGAVSELAGSATAAARRARALSGTVGATEC